MLFMKKGKLRGIHRGCAALVLAVPHPVAYTQLVDDVLGLTGLQPSFLRMFAMTAPPEAFIILYYNMVFDKTHPPEKKEGPQPVKKRQRKIIHP